jgi:hypothetical protein
MSGPLYTRSDLDLAFTALQQDLLHEDGPRISTMRNYRFAIVPYDPKAEFELRAKVQTLTRELTDGGWVVLSLSLQQLMLQRIRDLGDDVVQHLVRMETTTAGRSRDRSLKYLRDKLAPQIEGPDGIAADCSRRILEFVAQHPDKQERTLALIGRAGALYPFLRSSALLRHLDGRTNNVPVVLLYPGRRIGPTGLSFMGQLDPDNDYRPRIYP